MKYIIWVTQDDETEKMYAAPVDKIEKEYFIKEIIPSLQPISQDFYTESFVVILQTLARWSYILYDEKIYWCIEWDPGLIVLEIQKNGTLQALALRSPNPSFGNRIALAEDLKFQPDYEDYENHQYSLIFDAWDAQFDKEDRKYRKFEPVNKDGLEKQHFDKCIIHIDNLAPIVEEKYQQDTKNFMDKCQARIDKWADIGKRTLLKHKTPVF